MGELTKEVNGPRLEDGLLGGGELEQKVAEGGGGHHQKVHRRVGRRSRQDFHQGFPHWVVLDESKTCVSNKLLVPPT